MRELGELEITKAAKEAEEIILIISMVGSLSISVEAVRIRVIEFITEVFEKFTSISYQKHEGEHSDKIEVSYLPQYIPKGFEVIGEEQIFLEKVSLITFFILCISVKRMKEVIFMWKKVLYFLTWILSIMQL
ncbi:MAG: hypothetical protein E6370_01770 [Clostridiales bacterium]|nr:hypothetical protein [Clostridiales bacterium]MDU6973036.1 hypothetical protein [Clostridiales bacterium]